MLQVTLGVIHIYQDNIRRLNIGWKELEELNLAKMVRSEKDIKFRNQAMDMKGFGEQFGWMEATSLGGSKKASIMAQERKLIQMGTLSKENGRMVC